MCQPIFEEEKGLYEREIVVSSEEGRMVQDHEA